MNEAIVAAITESFRYRLAIYAVLLVASLAFTRHLSTQYPNRFPKIVYVIVTLTMVTVAMTDRELVVMLNTP